MMRFESYSEAFRFLLSSRPPRPVLASIVLSTLLATASPILAQDSAVVIAEKNASAGVYTGDQGKRGEAAYTANCLSCHSAKAYTGEDFKLNWLTRSVYDLFNRIRTTMPDDNPGVLERQIYADIVAYMLSLNGYPAGAAELPSEDEPLKHIKIDSMPKPPASHGLWSAVLLRRQLGGKTNR